MSNIKFIDRPCGWGKTHELIKSLKNLKKFVVVVPLLSETVRVQFEAEKLGVKLHRPGFINNSEIEKTKGEHLIELLKQGKNVVCTHELIYRLGAAASLTRMTLHGEIAVLSEYNLIIDEVLCPIASCPDPKPKNFLRDFIGLGLAEIGDNGLVSPTKDWEIRKDDKRFMPDLYAKAKSKALHFTSGNLLIQAFPINLMTIPKSVSVYTFHSEGSYLVHYVRLLQRKGHNLDIYVDSLSESVLAEWRREVASALDIRTIPALEGINFGFTGQTKTSNKADRKNIARQVSNALSNLRYRQWKSEGVRPTDAILTCAKSNWYSSKLDGTPGCWAKSSRMFGRRLTTDSNSRDGVSWVANTTRGTNDFSSASHAIYLFDQFPNPNIVNYLFDGMDRKQRRKFMSDYALSELLQWLFRTRIRKGGLGLDKDGVQCIRGERGKVVLYLPSPRMRKILVEWLETGAADQFDFAQFAL